MSPSTVLHLWEETPLVRSHGLSERVGANTLQPAKSFKYRGISHFIHVKHSEDASRHFVIASSGNAAIAAALACKALGARCSTFVPTDTNANIVEYLGKNGADVVLEGSGYPAAFIAATRFQGEDGTRIMVPAYDNELVWEGHASMMNEIAIQLPDGVRPDAVICAVGGGGLLGGVLLGCEQEYWSDVPVIAVETHGASCLYHSLLLNKNPSHKLPEGISEINADGTRLARLPAVTSRATSLGALSPSAAVVRKALAHPGGVIPVSMTDERCMKSVLLLADYEKIIVELACAAAVAVAADSAILRKALGDKIEGKNIVVIACGGVKVSMQDMVEYLAITGSGSYDNSVLVAGEEL
ncbi:tryptophan synthase beta subunit-like PLP-dependent enzyme [Auricularia subglabra TFB-10046 SS5]|nr:tryptophan synthase beta subunit-like PLP-dependent enzyme [Auricularia subglabra TFB-10046 SS5]